MKKIIYKITRLGVWLMVLFGVVMNFSHAIEVALPSAGGQADVNVKYKIVDGNESHTIKLIQTVNEYLRFFVGLVAFVLIVYTGIKILSAQGDKEQIKKSYDMLIAAVITIVVALLAYTVVKIVVNLF